MLSRLEQARRKEGSNSIRTETTHRCDFCNKDFHSRIGLFSHKRRCCSPAGNLKKKQVCNTHTSHLDRRRPLSISLNNLLNFEANGRRSKYVVIIIYLLNISYKNCRLPACRQQPVSTCVFVDGSECTSQSALDTPRR